MLRHRKRRPQKTNDPRRASAGGAAAIGGTDYEMGLAARASVYILAQTEWEDLYPTAPPVRLSLQSGAHVDDIEVEFSDRLIVYCQSKYTISLKTGSEAPLRKALAQMLDQHERAGPKSRHLLVLAYAQATGASKALSSLTKLFMQRKPTRAEVLQRNGSKDLVKCLETVENIIRELRGKRSWMEISRFLHVSRFWNAPVGANGRISVDPGGLLRRSVLRDRSRASAVAICLRDNAALVASSRSSVDIFGLRDLVRPVAALREVPDYRDDWERLEEVSEEAECALRERGKILWNGVDLRVSRSKTLFLIGELQSCSLLITGEPGDGKSTLIADISRELRQDKTNLVILLRADECLGATLAEVSTNMKLEHCLDDVLRAAPDVEHIYLLVDALDRLREDNSRNSRIVVFRDLIKLASNMNDKWRVLASIRSFDLAYNRVWKELFPGQPIDASSLDTTTNVRHFVLQPLSEGEREELLEPLPEVAAAIRQSSSRTRALLATPYHLKLLAEISPAIGDLSTIDRQRLLFDAYWKAQINERPQPFDRTNAMLSMARCRYKLRVSPVPLELLNKEHVDGEIVVSLCMDGLLRPVCDCIAFSHDLIMDYCLARIFDSQGLDSIEDVRPSPSIFMAIAHRSALRLWLDGLWYNKRDDFWKAFFVGIRPSVSGVGRIAFAHAAVHFALLDGDLDPLSNIVDLSSEGVAALRFTCGLACADPAALTIQPWLSLCRKLVLCKSQEVLKEAAQLLSILVKKRSELRMELSVIAGDVARKLLIAILECGRDADALCWAVDSVIETANSDIASSSSTLERLLESRDIPGVDEALLMIGMNIPQLLDASVFVARFYERLLVEIAKSKTDHQARLDAWLAEAYARSDERIGSPPRYIQSKNERVSHWLGRHVHLFLKRQPVLGAQVIGRSLRSFVTFSRRSVMRVQMRGREFDIVPHHSRFVRSNDLESRLIDALRNALAMFAGHNQDIAEQIIEALIDVAAPAEVWAAIIEQSAASLPIFVMIADLSRTPANLRIFSRELAHAIRRLRPDLGIDDLRSLQDAILALTDNEADATVRQRLQRAIDAPLRSTDSPSFEGDDEDDDAVTAARLQNEGNDSNPENARIRDCLQSLEPHIMWLESRVAEYRPMISAPRAEEAIVAVRSLLAVCDDSTADARQIDDAWGRAALLASLLAQQGFDSIADVLLVASQRSEIARREWGNSDLLNRGRGEARTESVPGLLALAVGGHPQAIHALQQLVTDTEPAIRFRIASDLKLIAEMPDDLRWPIAKRLLKDSHPEVVSVAVQGIRPFYKHRRHDTLELVTDALERDWTKAPPMLREIALRQVGYYVLFSDEESALSSLRRILIRLPEYVKPLSALIYHYHLTIVQQPEDAKNSESARSAAQVRSRAWRLLKDVATAALNIIRRDGILEASNAMPRADRPAISELVQDVAHEIYLASGASKLDEHEQPEQPSLNIDGLATFWHESKDLLRLLGTSGILSAANYVLETLEYLLSRPVNILPKLLLELIFEVAHSAVQHGYSRDWNGMEVIDRILRRCVAERGSFMAEEETLKRVNEIIDEFLQAGWYKAYLLARDLDLSR
jgi:hypothetical protein